MNKRSATARRIPKYARESDYADRQIDWSEVHDRLTRQSKTTIVGWIVLQKRDFQRMRPSRIREKLSLSKSELQIIQDESDAHPYDVTPIEWLTLDEVPTKRNLVQLERQKKDSGEKPRWDTWIRLTPPEKLSLRQHSMVNDLVRERKMETAIAQEHKRFAALSDFEKEREWAEDLHGYAREQEDARLDRQERKRLVYYRLNQRWGNDGLEEWRRKRALALHKARQARYAEQVNRMNEARAAKRRGE